MPISSVMSVRPCVHLSACISCAPSGWIFMKFDNAENLDLVKTEQIHWVLYMAKVAHCFLSMATFNSCKLLAVMWFKNTNNKQMCFQGTLLIIL
jgi:hypothetical protein